MKEIKFNYKQKPFTCGPCALRMILETLLDRDISEEKITHLLGATEETGAPFSFFDTNLAFLLNQICSELKIDNRFIFLIKQESNKEELQHLQSTGYMVMLNYKKPNNQPHWAVLKSLNQDVITLMDPDFGPNYQYKWDQFNWSGGEKIPTCRAVIAIKYN